MSLSESAVDRLRQCLSALFPSLLVALSNLRAAHPQQLLLPFGLVSEALKPLIDTQDVKDAFGLVQHLSSADKDGPEVRTRNLCLEISNNELRKVVLEQPSVLDSKLGESDNSKVSQSELVSTLDRLDSILALSLHDLVDPTLPLSLVEELIESQPISTCSLLFGYTESRVKPLTVDLHPTRGKGLVLLRTCNELLRRLSKPSQEQTVFAGRILCLLAKVFPLGERSGVNLRGDFNIENRTYIEENTEDATDVVDDSGDRDERDQIFKVEYEFYELFWKVQRFFSNPPLLMGAQDSSRPSTRSATPADTVEADHAISDEDPAPDGAKGAMAELRINTSKILKLFGAVTKREKELAGAASAEEAKSTSNKRVGNAAQADSGSATPLTNKRRSDSGVPSTGYFVGKLIGKASDEPPKKRIRPDIVDGIKTPGSDEAVIEEYDVANADEAALGDGGHFFPTYLTGRKLFEYEIRDGSFRKHILVQYLVLFQYLLSFTPAAKESWKDWKNKTLQALFTLEDADERWIRSTWREIQALIREIQPDGRLFLESVLEVLKREANWIRWKTESCPSIEKPPLSPEQIAQFASARALLLRKAEAYPHRLGTAALSELWLDGLKPPVAGTRRAEDETGNYVTIATDGLEELEFLPPIPSLEHYNKSIVREKMKLDMRKQQLGIDATANEAQLSKEEQDKLGNDERVQATIETMQSLAWRALRVASRDNLHLFGKPDRPENIEGLLKAMEDERNPKPKPAQQSEVATTEGEVAKDAQEPGKPADGSQEQAAEGSIAEHPGAASTETGTEEVVAKTMQEQDTEMKEAESEAPETAKEELTADPTERAGKEIDKAVRDPSSVPVAISPVPASQQVSEPVEEGKSREEVDPTTGWDMPAGRKDDAISGLDTQAAKDDATSGWEMPTAQAPDQTQDVEMSEATR